MKRKRIDITYLKGVDEFEFKLIEDKSLNCFIAIKKIIKNNDILVVEHEGEKVELLKEGQYVVEYISLKDKYVVRTFIDEDKRAFAWYIDITKENGIDIDGIPYYDDLYLDITIYNDKILLLDEDELKEAFDDGIINEFDFELAYSVKNSLMKELENKNNVFVNRGSMDVNK